MPQWGSDVHNQVTGSRPEPYVAASQPSKHEAPGQHSSAYPPYVRDRAASARVTRGGSGQSPSARAPAAPPPPRFHQRGFNPDRTAPAGPIAVDIHDTGRLGHHYQGPHDDGPDGEWRAGPRAAADAPAGAQSHGYRARPIHGTGTRYDAGGTAAWAFRPADYSRRAAGDVRPGENLGLGSGGLGQGLGFGREGGKGGEDPLLRFVDAARGSLDSNDLDLARRAQVGFKTAPGAPDARLVGGEWRWIPKPSKQLPDGRLWTEYFGPLGGGSQISTYYGKSYDQHRNHGYEVY